MANNPVSPLNDFVRQVFVELIDPITGKRSPCTTGTVSGFLATSNAPDADAADPDWLVDGVHIGGANGFPNGTWQLLIDGSKLTVDKMRAAFANATPYFIAQRTNDFRAVERLKYAESRNARIE